jgi:hypothetical protein
VDELPFSQLLRLYLDPFALFKNIHVEPDGLEYNRCQRGVLLIYVRRWATIAVLCAGGMAPLGAMARAEPILFIPIIGLELGFATGLCMLLLAIAVYIVLGLEK